MRCSRIGYRMSRGIFSGLKGMPPFRQFRAKFKQREKERKRRGEKPMSGLVNDVDFVKSKRSPPESGPTSALKPFKAVHILEIDREDRA